jgi:hypothetical protein
MSTYEGELTIFGLLGQVDSSLAVLIPGAMLVGGFLGDPLCLLLSLYPDWNCALTICSIQLPGDLLFSLFFILPPFGPPGLS